MILYIKLHWTTILDIIETIYFVRMDENNLENGDITHLPSVFVQKSGWLFPTQPLNPEVIENIRTKTRK